MQIKISIILFCFPFLMMSRCEDPLPAGLETTVSGNVIDETINIPLENHKLRLLEDVQNGPYRVLDSTITDIDGYYTMNFTTSGEGVRYYIEALENDTLKPLSNNFREIDSIGNFNTIDFSFFKLYPYTINITGENLTDNAITIRSNYTSTSSIDPLVGSNFLETRLLLISPYFNHELKFSRTLENGENQRYIYLIEASNVYAENEVNITLTDDVFETIN